MPYFVAMMDTYNAPFNTGGPAQNAQTDDTCYIVALPL